MITVLTVTVFSTLLIFVLMYAVKESEIAALHKTIQERDVTTVEDDINNIMRAAFLMNVCVESISLSHFDFVKMLPDRPFTIEKLPNSKLVYESDYGCVELLDIPHTRPIVKLYKENQ